jgi:lipocalin
MPTTLRGSDNFDTAGGNAVKAWVNFNGTITSGDSRRASFNVSSVTRNGVGNYTVNFTTALPDANYAMAWASDPDNTSPWVVGRSTSSASSCVVLASRPGTGFVDASQVNVTFFR